MFGGVDVALWFCSNDCDKIEIRLRTYVNLSVKLGKPNPSKWIREQKQSWNIYYQMGHLSYLGCVIGVCKYSAYL